MQQKATPDGYVYLEICKGNLWIAPVRIVGVTVIEENIRNAWVQKNHNIAMVWTHHWCPIQFALVVDDFGVKYTGKENAKFLMIGLKYDYKISVD